MASLFKLAVTGCPVAHSRSPQIFSRFFSLAGIEGFYSRIAADSLPEAVETAFITGITGLNVTSPFKERAAEMADFAEDSVKKLGAANTLILGRDCLRGISGINSNPEKKEGGKYEKSSSVKTFISAFNTDYLGVYESIKKYGTLGKAVNAFVIGSGGAGVAASYAMSLAGFNVTVFNRTLKKAEEATGWIKNCRVESLDKITAMAPDADIIINALPSGVCVFDPRSIGKNSVVFDADYRNSPYSPSVTGGTYNYISGITWLINQAVDAFRIFTGAAFPEGHAVAFPENLFEMENKKNISLIGFMGSGKTTTGNHLSNLLGTDFIDIDKEIEKSENMSIKQIFTSRGEAYFRQVEKRITASVFEHEKNKVISCGGGAVKDKDNRAAIIAGSFPVWLASPPEISAGRIKDTSRPLLNSDDRIKAAAELFSERVDLYGSTASLIIDSSKRGALETAERINEEISFIFKS